MLHPKEALLDGAKILDPVLPLTVEGRGGLAETSRGVNSSVKTDGLNCISGKVSDWCATTSATRAPLTSRTCENLECGISAAAFHDLAHDLGLAEDFLSGSAAVLRTAAATEASHTAEQNEQAMAGRVGDLRQRQHLRERFREGSYTQVVAFAETLKYPDQMTESERRMVEIAGKKTLS